MTSPWKMWEDPKRIAVVLEHPNGARAYFSTFRIGDMLMRCGPMPKEPFQALAWMIQNGLTPYKVEGDMLPELTQRQLLEHFKP